jgi:succinate dehydrogenase/fumarate reductase flavoprotein subunit
MFSMLAGFPYGILIDVGTGKRFINEQADRKLLVDAMLSSGRESIAIVDQKGGQHASTLDQCLKRGVVKKFESIEELAVANNVPIAPLKETIEVYNSLIEKGRDDRFGKPLPIDLLPIRHPPYYSIRLVSKVHHCMGGVQINAEAQVINIETHQPILRFYAAGEVTGGVHGASRLGSNAIPECIIFGRIAGKNAAAQKPRP